MLELKALTKEYRSKSGNSITALKNVTLELPEKGLIFIVGKKRVRQNYASEHDRSNRYADVRNAVHLRTGNKP